MTNKKLLLLTVLFFMSFPRFLHAQDRESGRYVVEQRYILQLVWYGDEYTSKYEVVIERSEGRKHSPFMREFTELPNFQVSLAPGKYRYRITPYDFLDQPGEASDWVDIEIKPAPTAAAEDADSSDSENKINLYVSAAWAPIIPLYGRLREIFGIGFNAIGASVRFGALYNGLQWFSPGVEISTSWYALNNDQSGDKIGVQTGVTGFNIVAQKKLPNPSMAVTVKAGAALAFQVGEINIEDYSYSTGGLIPQINIEASFLWFAYKRMYLEAGIGFSHLFGKDDNSGFLRPWIGAGWEF